MSEFSYGEQFRAARESRLAIPRQKDITAISNLLGMGLISKAEARKMLNLPEMSDE